MRGTLSAQGISNASSLRAAIQQQLIQFGAVPNLPSDVLANTGLDTSGTAQLAAENPFSTLAQLAQAAKQAQQKTVNTLAARGILSSGETGYQEGLLGQQEGQQQYDATNALLSSIGTLNQQYVAGQQAAAQQLAQGALTAENTAATNYAGNTPKATYDPATGLYKDANGNYYDHSGNPVSAPAPSSPAPTPAPSAPTPSLPSNVVQYTGQRIGPGQIGIQ